MIQVFALCFLIIGKEGAFVYDWGMYPILARLGPYFIYSYTVVMGLGLAAASLTAYLQLRHQPQRWATWVNGLLVGLCAGLVVGRLLFVWGNGDYYQANPQEIGLIGLGGVNYHGAVITGTLVFALWQAWQGQAVMTQLGVAALPLVVWSLAGWVACYLEGCAYGQVTTVGWLAGNLPDSYGVFQVRVQTQLLGVVWCTLVGLGVGVALIRGRVSASTLFWLAVILLCGGRALISLGRGDPMPQWQSVRWDTLADSALTVFAAIGLFLAQWHSPRPTDNLIR